MNKIIEFLKQSNRCKHLIGGLLVGLLAFSPWTALYAATVAASCLELKDKLKGGFWDWIDWSCLLYTSPSPRDRTRSRMPSSA